MQAEPVGVWGYQWANRGLMNRRGVRVELAHNCRRSPVSQPHTLRKILEVPCGKGAGLPDLGRKPAAGLSSVISIPN